MAPKAHFHFNRGALRTPRGPIESAQLAEADGARLLTAEEEVALARSVQRLRALESQRKAAVDEGLDMTSTEAWAAIAGVDAEALQAARQRGLAARATLIQSNLRLVISIATKFRWSGLDREDLLQEGAFGLSRAVERYDPERGFRFSTYATFWIRQAVLRACAEQSRVIRLPAHVHDQVSNRRPPRRAPRPRPATRVLKGSGLGRETSRQTPQVTSLNRASAHLSTELGRDATDDELASHLELPSKDKLSFIRRCAHGDARSLDYQLAQTRGKGSASSDPEAVGACLLESVADDSLLHPEEHVLHGETQAHILEVFERDLSDREREVLGLRFGLRGEEPTSKTKIAAMLAVSREMVRKIEVRALTKLRKSVRVLH